jgi:AcrR family transcriptional regulator
VVADARPVWSRELLIDTAVELLHTGGAAAITVDAVTTSAQVSRATLYRQFPGCGELVAAAFNDTIPPVPPPPPPGPWRERLGAVLVDQAKAVTESPHLVEGLCWLALDRGSAVRLDEVLSPDDADADERRALSDHLRQWCLTPLYDVLDCPQARADLGEVDRELVFAFLVAPTLCGATARPRVWAGAAVAAFAAAHEVARRAS